MAKCACYQGWLCEEYPRGWPHDRCPGPGVECMNPTCPYGKDALRRKPLDEEFDREHYPNMFDAHGEEIRQELKGRGWQGD